MKRAKTLITIVALIIAFFIISVIGGGAFFGRTAAFAASESGSNVLEDLRKDPGFTIEDYPFDANDKTINVIQIAEGSGGELFIYTYQPSQQTTYLVASSINISKQKNNNLEISFPNYKLKLVSCTGVFCKYRVEGFELEKTVVRYYNISNILRPFEYLLDKLPAVGSESEVPNAVGQLWTVRTVGDNVEYDNTVSDVVTITKKYVGFLHYLDGMTTSGVPGIYGGIKAQHTIRNFVAFSTDRAIDQLKQVELQYALADCSYEYCANPFHGEYKNYVNKTKSEPVTQDPVVISADEKDENVLHGWFGDKYRWDKIQSTSDFLAEQDNQSYELMNSDGVSSIEGTQWVLNFYKETREVTGNANIADNHLFCNYKQVSDVIILRLMFEHDGESYNLGVVDSKMTGDDKPLNGNEPLIDLLPTWAIVLIIIGVALVVLIVLAIIFPIFGKVLLMILKGLLLVISAPFRLIGRAIENRKRNKPKTAKHKHSKGATGKHKRKTGKKKGGKK